VFALEYVIYYYYYYYYYYSVTARYASIWIAQWGALYAHMETLETL
jgi:hypothetical protein